MVTFETTIQDHLLRMYADFPLKNAAGAIFKTLVQISAKTNIFSGRFVMCFGWAHFFIDERQEENGDKFWVVQTTDYKNDPQKNRTDNVTVSLLVQNMQIEAVQKSETKLEPVTFKDTILVLKEAVGAENVMLSRGDATKDGDSGWYFGLVDDPNEDNHKPDEYERVPSYELLNFRTEALRVLQMPVGTVAVINKNNLIGLFDNDGNPLKFTTEEERKKFAAERAEAEKRGEAPGIQGVTFEEQPAENDTKE